MTISQLIPGYLGAKTKPADFNAFVALCWAVADHRPDLDEDEVIKRVKTWSGSDFRQNAADILAGPKGMTDEEAEEIERVIQRRTCRVVERQPEMARAGTVLVRLLLACALVSTAIMVLSFFVPKPAPEMPYVEVFDSGTTTITITDAPSK